MAIADHHQRPVLVDDDARAYLADGGAQKAKPERHRVGRIDPSGIVVRATRPQRARHCAQVRIDALLGLDPPAIP